MSAQQIEYLRKISAVAHDNNGITLACRLQTELTSQLIEQYDSGQLEKDSVIKKIVELYEIVYRNTLREESARLKEIGAQFGHIGEEGGIIYGGRNHPLYSTPQFYNLG